MVCSLPPPTLGLHLAYLCSSSNPASPPPSPTQPRSALPPYIPTSTPYSPSFASISVGGGDAGNESWGLTLPGNLFTTELFLALISSYTNQSLSSWPIPTCHPRIFHTSSFPFFGPHYLIPRRQVCNSKDFKWVSRAITGYMGEINLIQADLRNYSVIKRMKRLHMLPRASLEGGIGLIPFLWNVQN